MADIIGGTAIGSGEDGRSSERANPIEERDPHALFLNAAGRAAYILNEIREQAWDVAAENIGVFTCLSGEPFGVAKLGDSSLRSE